MGEDDTGIRIFPTERWGPKAFYSSFRTGRSDSGEKPSAFGVLAHQKVQAKEKLTTVSFMTRHYGSIWFEMVWQRRSLITRHGANDPKNLECASITPSGVAEAHELPHGFNTQTLVILRN